LQRKGKAGSEADRQREIGATGEGKEKREVVVMGRSIGPIIRSLDFLVGKVVLGPKVISGRPGLFFYDANLARTIHQSTTGKLHPTGQHEIRG
jgi:hypothetical protein